MKLEIGQFVRTRNGIIDKIVDITYNDNYNTEPNRILLEKTKGYIEIKEHNIRRDENGEIKAIYPEHKKSYWILAIDVVKASHTLLGNNEEPCLIEVGDYVNGCLVVNTNYFYDIHIKTIVTKEQFSQIEYKVGE